MERRSQTGLGVSTWREGRRDLPDAGFGTGECGQHGGGVGGEVFEEHGLQLGAGGGEGAAREGDDGGDGGVVQGLVEDFLADEAAGAGEDDLHDGVGLF